MAVAVAIAVAVAAKDIQALGRASSNASSGGARTHARTCCIGCALVGCPRPRPRLAPAGLGDGTAQVHRKGVLRVVPDEVSGFRGWVGRWIGGWVSQWVSG